MIDVLINYDSNYYFLLSLAFTLLFSCTLANFFVPKAGDVFNEVKFSEIYGAAAEKIVRQYKDDALGVTPDYTGNKKSRYGDVDVRGRYPPPPSKSRYESGRGGYM